MMGPGGREIAALSLVRAGKAEFSLVKRFACCEVKDDAMVK